MQYLVSVLVEGDRHDSVCEVECLLHSVAVVDVDVDVQHSGVNLEELQDCDDDVVDEAEAGGLGLLGVVQPAGPVHRDVAAPAVQLQGGHTHCLF